MVEGAEVMLMEVMRVVVVVDVVVEVMRVVMMVTPMA